jgi:hypothetical protein
MIDNPHQYKGEGSGHALLQKKPEAPSSADLDPMDHSALKNVD